MIKTTLDDLTAPSPVWAHLFAGEEYICDTLAFAYPPQYVHRIMRGGRCLSKPQLLQEWAAAWQFPWYFGHNWDAFEECLRDLAWLPAAGYIATITAIDRLLVDEQTLAALLEILDNAATYWRSDHDLYKARPATAFHVVFQHDPRDHGTRQRYLDLFSRLAIEPGELAIGED